jgi:hypothetical protein
VLVAVRFAIGDDELAVREVVIDGRFVEDPCWRVGTGVRGVSGPCAQCRSIPAAEFHCPVSVTPCPQVGGDRGFDDSTAPDARCPRDPASDGAIRAGWARPGGWPELP